MEFPKRTTVSDNGASSSDDVGMLDPDDIHWVLSNQYRRSILRCLTESEESKVSIDQLTDYVFEEVGGPGAGGELEDKQVIRNELIHKHIPILVQRSVINHTTQQDSITGTDHLSQFEPHLTLEAKTTNEAGKGWLAGYAGASGLSGLVVLGIQTNNVVLHTLIAPILAVFPTTIALLQVTVAMFGSITLGQLFSGKFTR